MQILQALAHESKVKLLSFSASDLLLGWQWGTERIIKVYTFFCYEIDSEKMIFEMASYHSPSILYIEDIEAIGPNWNPWEGENEWKRRIKVEFLIQCQRFDFFEVENEQTKTNEWKPVTVIAGTECPWELDRAILRRFNKKLC